MTKKKPKNSKQRSYQRQREQIARRKRTTRDSLSSRSQDIYEFSDGRTKTFADIAKQLMSERGVDCLVFRPHEVKEILSNARNRSTPSEWEMTFQDMYSLAHHLRELELSGDVPCIPRTLQRDNRLGIILPQILIDVLDEMEQEMPARYIKTADEVLDLLRDAAKRVSDISLFTMMMLHFVAHFETTNHSSGVGRLDPDEFYEWKEAFGRRNVQVGAFILGTKQWLKWDRPHYEYLKRAQTLFGTVDFSDVRAA